jgi:hypothetical protein
MVAVLSTVTAKQIIDIYGCFLIAANYANIQTADGRNSGGRNEGSRIQGRRGEMRKRSNRMRICRRGKNASRG